LPGDANLDGVVDGVDVDIFNGNWKWLRTGASFQDGDFNGDGGVFSSADRDLLFPFLGINLQNLSILADFDGDYDVDADDLDWIGDNIGLTGATFADGDLNGDGLVTLDDLDLAFMQFGLGWMVAS